MAGRRPRAAIACTARQPSSKPGNVKPPQQPLLGTRKALEYRLRDDAERTLRADEERVERGSGR